MSELLSEENELLTVEEDNIPDESSEEAIPSPENSEGESDVSGFEAEGKAIDYEELIASDVLALKAEFPELAGISDVTDLSNPMRYAALRDLGLTPREAYLATASRITKDTRSHLRSAHGRSAAASGTTMSQIELATARSLFPDKNDSELQRLYKRVTK